MWRKCDKNLQISIAIVSVQKIYQNQCCMSPRYAWANEIPCPLTNRISFQGTTKVHWKQPYCQASEMPYSLLSSSRKKRLPPLTVRHALDVSTLFSILILWSDISHHHSAYINIYWQSGRCWKTNVFHWNQIDVLVKHSFHLHFAHFN